ncbi:MAG TPA: rhomboid family intramembrane serine protease [Candidatus Angelobacter sp.]|nr:rhomboid family intramembrane serine protease [Candidatus Angelobacter sp.]
MPSNRSFSSSTIGFPPFRGALRILILISTAIYIAIVLLWAFRQPWAAQILEKGGLLPDAVRHGWVWQLVTHGFVQLDPWNFLMCMLGVYFLGSAVEGRIGSRAFYELYFTSLIGSGLLGCVLAWTLHLPGGSLGAGAAVNAILMVFFLLNRDAPIMLLFIPIPIPVKYIVIFTAAVEGAYFLIYHFALFFMVLLLGLVMGYVWYAFLWRHSFAGMLQDRAATVRNGYYRWKRRRAGKKFQVYMSKHQHDPKQYFDEYGNFRPPGDDDDKKDRGPGGWVN